MELTPNLHAFLWTTPGANNCNAYLIRSAEKAILIDPGHAAHFDHVRSGLQRIGLTAADIDLVVGTHAHPDHIEAVSFFHDGPTRFALHRADWEQVQTRALLRRDSMAADPTRWQPDLFLTEGALVVGDMTLHVYHTPGHAPGAICLYWPMEKALFAGDLIFAGGLGRTDLPGGNGAQLKTSIRRMASLGSHWLLSGHGDVLSGCDAVAANFKQVENTWFAYV